MPTMIKDASVNPTQGYTAEACFSCRTAKRKCDKQLPVCSRCKRAKRQCLYGSNAHGIYGSIVPVTDEQIMKIESPRAAPKLALPSLPKAAWKSCRRCKIQKKFCDKAYPSCARCKRLDTACTYEQLDRLRLLSSQHIFSYNVKISKGVEFKPPYPVESKPYIPSLIRDFQDRMGLSAMQVDVDSLAYHLRSSWIRHALTDPCLFHATLYAASAQVDAIHDTEMTTPTIPNCITLYHHTSTIRILSFRIASGADLDDVTIAAALLLLITGSLQKDYRAAEAHRLGLLQMVALRGGLGQLGFDGFLAQMIEMNMVLPAVVFDRLDAFPMQELNSQAANSLPNLALERLRTTKKGNVAVKAHMVALFEHVQQLLLAVDRGEDETGDCVYDFVAVRDVLDEGWPWGDPLPDSMSSSENAMLRSCLALIRILRYLLDDRQPPASDELVMLVEELKSHIPASDPNTWLKYAPHGNLWVIMVGMAVSPDLQGRLWFLMNERCVTMAIKATRPAIWEKFWSSYRWMRRLIQVRSALWSGCYYDAQGAIPV